MHAGVGSDAGAGCTSEGWTSDMYLQVFLVAQDAVTWQDVIDRFVASSSLVNQQSTFMSLAFQGLLPRTCPVLFISRQSRDGQCNRSSSNCCDHCVNSGGLLRAQVLVGAPASRSESAAPSAGVTGRLHTGTHAMAAHHHAGSHRASSGTAECCWQLCLAGWPGGESAVATPVLLLVEILRREGLSVCLVSAQEEFQHSAAQSF